MISIRKRLFLFFLLLPALAGAKEPAGKAAPRQEQTHHYCNYQDVAGNVYHLALLSENPQGRETRNLIAFPHQYIILQPNNTYSFVRARKEITAQSNMNEALAWTGGNAKKYVYVIGKKGDLALFKDKKVTERYQCIAVSQNNGEYQAGDLILTTYPDDENSYELFKLYRRWVASTPKQ